MRAVQPGILKIVVGFILSRGLPCGPAGRHHQPTRTRIVASDKSRPCQRSYSRYHSAVSRDRGRQVWRVMFGFEEVCEHMSKNEQVI